MAVIRCENGHFYDSGKYRKCPHCENGMAMDSVTVAEESGRQIEDYAMQYGQGRDPIFVKMDEERTVGLYSGRGTASYVAGWLVCTDGPEKGNDYRIFAGFNRIGRGFGNDIVLQDPRVAGKNHCAVCYEEKKNRFYLTPQEGNAAYLDGELLSQAKELLEGQKIQIGSCTLELAAFCKGERRWEK